MHYTYIHAFITPHTHRDMCWQWNICMSASPRRTVLYCGFLSSCLATNYFQATSGFLCFLSTFLLRSSIFPVNPQLSYNSLFLQSCWAGCLWPHWYPASSCKLKPMFERAHADIVSVPIYSNPWAHGHSRAVGNLVKRQERVGVCTMEVAVPAGLLG